MIINTNADRGRSSRSRWILQVILCLVAFAANSIFCRQALVEGQIDPESLTAILLASGGLFLMLILFGAAQVTTQTCWVAG